jgi:uncharacterized protein YkwD
MFRYSVLLFICAAFLLAPFRTTQAAPARAELTPFTSRVIDLINVERAHAGLHALRVHDMLMAEAQRFSGVQASMGRLSHRGNDGSTAGQRLTRAGYRWAVYGENLAAGQTTPEDLVAGWMNSPSHRANILSRRVVDLGVGHTQRWDDPSGFVNYYVLEVAVSR